MSNPVVLTPSAANKIRAAVTAISMPSRPYGILGTGARGGKPQPMPLDITIEQVEGVAHAFIRLKDLAVYGDGQRTNGDIQVDGWHCQSLATALNNGAEQWDAGSLGAAPGILYFYFYVASCYYNVVDNVYETLRWGIATGASQSAAFAAIPQPAASPSGSGDVWSIVAVMPLGWASMQGGVPAMAQSWRGSVLLPLLYPVDMVTDVQYDTTNKQIQKKVLRVYAPRITPYSFAAHPSSYDAWTMVTGGQAETYP